MSIVDALQTAGLIEIPADTSHPIPHFGDPEQEYQAAQESAVFLPEQGFGMLAVSGEDRAKFLQNFCTNDIKKMQPGDVCEAFFCNVKGRILALGIILCQPEQFLILTDASRTEFLHQHLDRYVITEDVTLAISKDVEALLVVGKNEEWVKQLPDTAGLAVFPWNNGFRPTCWLIGAVDSLVEAVKKCVDEGAIIAGHHAGEIIRISAGYPKYNIDISDENLAQEANRTEQAISFVKGCYLGQEPIARLDAMGHVNRQLERLTYEAETPLPVGSVIRSSAGDEFGTITSSSLIPGTHRGVALAMLKVKAAQAEELIAVAEDGTTTSVERMQSS